MNFNPRSLTGATEKIALLQMLLEFQSTLPHGSDYLDEFCPADFYGISIHAPSRERLYTLKNMLDLPIISIHAPSRERHLKCYTLTCP